MSEIQQIELSIEEAKQMVAARDAVNKLSSNAAFKKVVLEGYMKEHAVKLTDALSNPAMADRREIVVEGLLAISYFKDFLRSVVLMGNSAEDEILEMEEHADMLRDEEEAA